jgi:hypothetical protein
VATGIIHFGAFKASGYKLKSGRQYHPTTALDFKYEMS